MSHSTEVGGLHQLTGSLHLVDSVGNVGRELFAGFMRGLYLEPTGELMLVSSPGSYVVGVSTPNHELSNPRKLGSPHHRKSSRPQDPLTAAMFHRPREGRDASEGATEVDERLEDTTSPPREEDQEDGNDSYPKESSTSSSPTSPPKGPSGVSSGSPSEVEVRASNMGRCALKLQLQAFPHNTITRRSLSSPRDSMPSTAEWASSSRHQGSDDDDPPDPWASPRGSAEDAQVDAAHTQRRRSLSESSYFRHLIEQPEWGDAYGSLEGAASGVGLSWTAGIRAWLRSQLHRPDGPVSGPLAALGRMLPALDEGEEQRRGMTPRRVVSVDPSRLRAAATSSRTGRSLHSHRPGAELLASVSRAHGLGAAWATQDAMRTTLQWVEGTPAHGATRDEEAGRRLGDGHRGSSVSASSSGDKPVPSEEEKAAVQAEARSVLDRAGRVGVYYAGGRRGSMDGPELVPLTGILTSPNCNFTMNVSLGSYIIDRDTVELRATMYTALMTICVLGQGIVTWIMFIRAMQLPAFATKLSLLSLGMQCLMDSYLTLMHLVGGVLWDSLFWAFTLLSLLQLFLFSILEMRLILISWRARRADIFAQGWEAIRRELGMLYAKFYGSLVLGLILMYYMWHVLPVLVTLAFSFWIPQIIHGAQHDQRPPMPVWMIVTNSCLRLVPPMYFYGCPSNFLTQLNPGAHNQGFALFLALYVAAQAGVLIAQSRKGARFFIPAILLPRKYDYHRPVRIDRTGRVIPEPDSDASSDEEEEGEPENRAEGVRDDAHENNNNDNDDVEGGGNVARGAGAADDDDDEEEEEQGVPVAPGVPPRRADNAAARGTRLGEAWRWIRRLYRRVKRRRARNHQRRAGQQQQWSRSLARRAAARAREAAGYGRAPYARLHDDDDPGDAGRPGGSPVSADAAVMDEQRGGAASAHRGAGGAGGDGDRGRSHSFGGGSAPVSPTAVQGVPAASGLPPPTRGRAIDAVRGSGGPGARQRSPVQQPAVDSGAGATAPRWTVEAASDAPDLEDAAVDDMELGDGHPGARFSAQALQSARRDVKPDGAAGGGGGGSGSAKTDQDAEGESPAQQGEEEEGPRFPHCAICLCDMELPLPPEDYMVAPCNHMFHGDCLVEWMGHKMECPVCRAPLPEI